VLDGAPATTAVVDDAADDDPPLLAAVTITRSVEPSSEPAAVYVEEVAPAIDEQFAPPKSQSSHW
jgi:hypothetical protein